MQRHCIMEIPLSADSVPEHNFDPSAFPILTIQEFPWIVYCTLIQHEWGSLYADMSPIVLNKWKMIENSNILAH